MRKKTIECFLGVSAVVAIVIALFSSNDRLTMPFNNAPEVLFAQFSAYNDLIFNLSSGYAVSVVLYFLIVFLPDHFRRQRIRKSALRVYMEFKESVLGIILNASGKSYGLDQIKELMAPDKFEEFFRFDETGSGIRWDEFLNGLNKYYAGKIVIELEILREEIQFIINNVDIDDSDAYTFLKRLSTVSYSMSKIGSDYDDQKMWGNFLWGIFAQWDICRGKLEKDLISDAINKI